MGLSGRVQTGGMLSNTAAREPRPELEAPLPVDAWREGEALLATAARRELETVLAADAWRDVQTVLAADAWRDVQIVLLEGAWCNLRTFASLSGLLRKEAQACLPLAAWQSRS